MTFAHNGDENGYWLLRSCTHEVVTPLNKWVGTGVQDCAQERRPRAALRRVKSKTAVHLQTRSLAWRQIFNAQPSSSTAVSSLIIYFMQLR